MESLIGGRFVIEREAGAGAMARVYCARDTTTNTTVALKILNSVGQHTLLRFEREVSALVEANHPGIVRYVAHGTTSTGQAFLAMEWLTGETLEARLERGPLDLEAALAMARAIGSALGAAHAHDLVHRDVKPGNIFLVDGDPARAKLLDFGLARDMSATFGLTNTGDLLGTPLFMSPEQARCELDIDARCDVYALGAVLYTAIAGRAPFLAPNLPGLLAKIVLEDPAPLPGVPRAIGQLVARLLAKQRPNRPADGTAAEAAIAEATSGLSHQRPHVALPSREQRVVSILLATNALPSQASLDATLGSQGGVLGLADGTTMVVFSGPETPTDLAVRAARYALGLRNPGSVVSLATGHAVLSGAMPMGEVIDRASTALSAPAGTVRVDAETAGLIEGRFEVAADAHGAVIVGERAGDLDPVRTLLGKPTRCIGRDRELAAIEGYFAECVADSAARAVIVVADAGVGKSRLAHEVQRRLATHSEAPEVIAVRCESITASSPFGAAAAALRSAHGRGEIASDEFLSELAGMPASAPSERMRAARENPKLMFEHIRSAWVSWLRRGCERGPVLLVIEDLHWADDSSVALVDAALAALADEPFLVLALARPEVRARKIWAAHQPHELRLDPLTKRASDRLVREALGARATDDVVAGILTRAEGNALFLEELVRAASNPALSALPVGIAGTLQLRFDGLRPESRTVLRVASVFGEQFPRRGIEVLVPDQLDIDRALGDLTSAELIRETQDGFAFRHGLVRETAYTMLPEDDRTLAHALAGELLAEQTAIDAAVVARHFELGQRHAEASHWYERAAEYALAHNDPINAIANAKRAQGWASDELRKGGLDLLIADAEQWRGDLPTAQEMATRATARLTAESADWLHAVGLIITLAGQRGDNATVREWVLRVLSITPEAGAVASLVTCLSRGSSQLAWDDDPALSLQALARANVVASGSELAPIAHARLEFARAYEHFIKGRVDAFSRTMDGVIATYDRIGARREELQMRVIALALAHLAGGRPDAPERFAEIRAQARAIGANYVADWATYERVLAFKVALDRRAAEAELEQLSPGFIDTPLFLAGYALLSCWLALREDDLAELARYVDLLASLPMTRRIRAGHAAFGAYLRFRRGEPGAVDDARRAIASISAAPGMIADMANCCYEPAFETLARAEAPDLAALLDVHLARLHGIGEGFTDLGLRDAFVYELPWHRRLHELRKQLG